MRALVHSPIFESQRLGQSGAVPIVRSPIDGLSDYGIGVWRERVHADTGAALFVSSPGAFGTYPWIDFERDYAAVFMTDDALEDIEPLVDEIIRILEEKHARGELSACGCGIAGWGAPFE